MKTKTIGATLALIMLAGCSTTQIDKRQADSPRVGRIFDTTFLAKTPDCRPVHLTRDGGLVLSGIALVILVDNKPTVALQSAESLEVCLPPDLHKITAIPASALVVPVSQPGSIANYVLNKDPMTHGELEVDTRPDMRFNVRISSLIAGTLQKTTLAYTGERMIR